MELLVMRPFYRPPSRRELREQSERNGSRPFFARVVTDQVVEGKHRDGSLRTSETRSARGYDLRPGLKVEAADGTPYRVAPDGSLRNMKSKRAPGTSARQARKAAKLARKLARVQARRAA